MMLHIDKYNFSIFERSLINQSINQSIYIAQRHNVSNALKRRVNTEQIKTVLK